MLVWHKRPKLSAYEPMSVPQENDLATRIGGIVSTLRARHLDRIAAGYAVTAWVVVQAASIVVPSFDVNSRAIRAVIIFFLLGFPVTLIGAWFAAPHASAHRARRKPSKAAYAIFAAFALILVVVAVDLSLLLSRVSAPTGHAQAAVANPGPPKNSIAVLPFANMSGDPKKEYFSDGIAEELLDDLAGIPLLQVAARTSSFAFKNANDSIKQIARLLSVRSVLEGSVRESGQHLRISVELIDAASGYRLWSSIYDRDLTDILTVQEDIARAITTALTKQFLPRGTGLRSTKRISSEAYQDYLLGKRQLESRTTGDTEAAIALFKTTISQAPDFADGFAALANADIILADRLPGRDDLIASAETALNNALRLDPHNVEALSARLDLSLHKLDWRGAIADAKNLQQAAPNSARVLHEIFRFYYFMAFPELAQAAARGATRLDPLSFSDRFNTASFLLHDARFPEAIAAAKAALALRPHHPVALAMLCVAAADDGLAPLASGTADELARLNANLASGSVDETAAPLCAFAIATSQHRPSDAEKIVDGLAKGFPQSGISAYDLGEKYAIAGDIGKADIWFSRAYDNRDFLIFLLPGDKLVPDAFRASPEYKALLERPLFRDWSSAHDQLASDLAGR
jgi:serine/threonine-protein kinase